jgi:hypothetical protein
LSVASFVLSAPAASDLRKIHAKPLQKIRRRLAVSSAICGMPCIGRWRLRGLASGYRDIATVFE